MCNDRQSKPTTSSESITASLKNASRKLVLVEKSVHVKSWQVVDMRKKMAEMQQRIDFLNEKKEDDRKQHKRIVVELQEKLRERNVQIKEKNRVIEKLQSEKRVAREYAGARIIEMAERLKVSKEAAQLKEENKKKDAELERLKDQLAAKQEQVEEVQQKFQAQTKYLSVWRNTNGQMIGNLWHSHQSMIVESQVQRDELEDQMKAMKLNHEREKKAWEVEKAEKENQLQTARQRIFELQMYRF